MGTQNNHESLNIIGAEIRMIFMIIMRLSLQSIEQRLNEANSGISAMQYGIIQSLSHQHYTISELSRRFMLDPSTLVPMVDRLEKKGLIQRSKDPKDRRRSPLLLTPKGVDFLKQLPHADDDDVIIKALHGMGHEKSQELLALMQDLIAQMPKSEDLQEHIQKHITAKSNQCAHHARKEK